MRDAEPLPIDDVLEDIASTLKAGNRLVVSAPPGAGKTTRVPLRLFNEDWCSGSRLILIQPRRIAARAAAERMAATLGEKVGDTIGLRTRLDVRVSNATRVEVVTDGVFTRQILSDPGLEGTACVIFDEFHERSLDADEGMALALDAQAILRPDLRLVIMSATLPEEIGTTFFASPIICSDGRMHPVETRYLGWSRAEPIERQAASAIRKALTEETGSILAFLPGAAEIRRTIEHLEPLPEDAVAAPLFGGLTPAEQVAAIAPAPPGTRKIVIATDIAESALTIEGVRVVVDAGYARRPRFDPVVGATRLETVRLSNANADQRRGRAGRTEPGVCYRLWRESETGGFAAAPVPEIENADLSSLLLDTIKWGAQSPADLQWLTPPKPSALSTARTNLEEVGAIGPDGSITTLGSRISSLPLSPHLAAMVLGAPAGEQAYIAALTAALLSERDLGGRSTDLRQRLEALKSARTPRERQMCRLAERWAKQATGTHVQSKDLALALARTMPGRLARLRAGATGRYVMSNGRGAFLDPSDPLCRYEWLVVADITGGGADLRITLAAPVSFEHVSELGIIDQSEAAELDLATGKVRARRRMCIGAIEIENAPMPSPPPETVRRAIVQAVAAHGLSVLPNAEALLELANRVQCLSEVLGDPWPAEFHTTLRTEAETWLPESDPGHVHADYSAAKLVAAASTLLPWSLHGELADQAPTHWTTPAGSRIAIDYATRAAPKLACPVQHVFGLKTHPAIAGGRLPLTFELLSPAGRPIAVTRDIGAFWRGGYADARKDMKARYPKHFWPEDPANEVARLRTTGR